MVVVAIATGVVLLLAVVAVTSYNRFVQQVQYIDNAWGNVEAELQRRYDLVPSLVETVRGYATHERATLDAVTRARAAAVADHGAPPQQAQSENQLVAALESLFAVSEAYPQLQASTSFLDLQSQLVTTEDRIQASRRFYNNNVRAYNERVQSVPSNLVARVFGFRARSYFEIDEMAEPPLTPRVTFDGDDRASG